MCTCEFCGTSFFPRPQTKSPRACNNLLCQKKRQAQNERSWHRQNNSLYLKNPKYHQDQRIERHQIILQTIRNLLEAILAGFTFKGITVDEILFKNIFSDFMFRVGLRKINKFCEDKNLPDHTALAAS